MISTLPEQISTNFIGICEEIKNIIVVELKLNK